MVSHCGFDWLFLDDQGCRAPFHVPVAICMSSLGGKINVYSSPLSNF